MMLLQSGRRAQCAREFRCISRAPGTGLQPLRQPPHLKEHNPCAPCQHNYGMWVICAKSASHEFAFPPAGAVLQSIVQCAMRTVHA